MSIRTPRLLRRSSFVIAALLSAAIMSVARAAAPDVLTQVPSDAYAVVVVNNVRTLSAKVSNAANRLNLTLPPDPVGFLTRNMGITKGFDANNSAAIVFLKPSKEHEAEGYFTSQPPAILLLPTSDAKGMLEPFTPGDPDKAGISEVTLPTPPGKGYVATVADKWVAFAQTKEDLTAYLARGDAMSKSLPADTLKVFDANDLVIWANVAKLSTGVDKTLETAQSDLIGNLDLTNLTRGQDAFSASLQRQLLTIVFNGVKQYFKDADSGMVTVRLTDSGATLGFSGGFIPGSPFANFIAAQKSAKPISFQGLPDGNFILAGALTWDPASLSSLANKVIQQVFSDETISKDPRAADLHKYADLIAQVIPLVRGETFVFLDPPAGGQSGYMHGAILIDTSDPAKLLDLQMQSIKYSSAMAELGGNADLKYTVEATPDAITVKGIKLSKTSVKITLREETPDKPINPASRAALPIVQAMYGPDGMTIYYGIVGQRVIGIFGSETATIESAITAALANSDSFSKIPAIAATKDQLVANPIGVSYLPVTRWILLADSIIRPLRPNVPPPPPPAPSIAAAPPIVVSAGVNGNTITQEIHVPIATISGIRDAITRLQGGPAARPGPGGMPGGAAPDLP